MTCIIGLKDSGKVYIGGDSLILNSGTTLTASDPKPFKKGDMIFASSGYARFSKIVRYSFTVPKHDKNLSTMEYLNTVFIGSLMKCCDDMQYNKKRESRAETSDSLIIGYDSRIFRMSCDYDVTEYDSNYISIGSGEDYALGSLFSTENSGLMASERIIKALEAAEFFNNGVRFPFGIVELWK